MLFFCDDVGIKHKRDIKKLEVLKEKYPTFKVNCAVIAKDLDKELIEWLKQDWIEVVVHGWEHDYPPECEREDKEKRIKMAFKKLKPLLPKKYGFRPPGFQMTATTYPILKKLGFSYVAHQNCVQRLDKKIIVNDTNINSHIYDKLDYDFKNINLYHCSAYL